MGAKPDGELIPLLQNACFLVQVVSETEILDVMNKVVH